MKQKSKPVDVGRRKFLGNAAAAGVGSALAATIPASTAIAATGEAEQNGKKAKGYQLTQHVLDYYKSAAS